MDGGSYDLQGLSPPSQAVLRAHELWFYYTGGQSYAIISSGTPNSGGAVCMAVLHRDGFISLDAGAKPGTVLTHPFKMPGSQLFINVDAPDGELSVEVLDDQGKVVARFRPLSGDLLCARVEWAVGDIARLKGRHTRLRFTLRQAQLCSYWLK